VDLWGRPRTPLSSERSPRPCSPWNHSYAERGIVLDAIGRLEPLDIALADVVARYDSVRIH